MAINKNHEFEELNGVKCAIVEKNASAERVAFLKALLALNGYAVETIPSPPPKTAAPAATDENETVPPAPSTFTIGVTDYTFNPINAIYGRALKTKEGQIVTPAYWQQLDSVSQDEIPYYERG